MEKSVSQSKTTILVVNGLIAALYVVLTLVVAPIAQGPIQFRVSESLNHLVVFNKKLLWGVFLGVVFFNLFFSDGGALDALFGGAQTFLALGITALSAKWIKNEKIRMGINIIAFSVSMILIAIMLSIVGKQPIGTPVFWSLYGSLFLSELIIMSISAPIMYGINKVVHFDKFK